MHQVDGKWNFKIKINYHLAKHAQPNIGLFLDDINKKLIIYLKKF